VGIRTRNASTSGAALPDYPESGGGQQNVAIAEGLGVSRPTVQLWRKRVHEQGIGEVWEIAPVAGGKRTMIKASETGSLKRPCRASPKA